MAIVLYYSYVVYYMLTVFKGECMSLAIQWLGMAIMRVRTIIDWDPVILCVACKRRGHPASKCDMLAMALFLERYTKSTMTSTDRDKIESAWLQRWKERLGNPSRLPRKAMKTYLEEMDITPDVLDDQMEWECWPLEDGIKDYEVHMDSGAPASL